MAKTLSNTQKIHAIKKIFDNDMKKASIFDMIYLVKKIAAIVYDISEEDFEKYEQERYNK